MAETAAPGGYFGRALVVDVTDGSSRALPLPEQVLRSYLGGAGLGEVPAGGAGIVMRAASPPSST